MVLIKIRMKTIEKILIRILRNSPWNDKDDTNENDVNENDTGGKYNEKKVDKDNAIGDNEGNTEDDNRITRALRGVNGDKWYSHRTGFVGICLSACLHGNFIWNHKIPSVYLRDMFSDSGSRIYLAM